MRVGIDARSLAEREPTGISIYTFQMVKALAYVAPETKFLLFSSGSSNAQAPLLAYLRNTFSNIEHVHLQVPNKVFHARAMLTGKPRIDTLLHTKYEPAIDVLFAPNIHILPLSDSVPLVLTLHDVSFSLFPQYLSLRRKLWHWAVNPQRLVQRAQACIAVSERTRQDAIHHLHAKPEQVVTIHSGIPKALPTETTTSTTLLSATTKPYFLVLSTLEPRKNIEAVLEAYKQYRTSAIATNLVPNALVIAGSAGWKSRSILERLRDTEGVQYIGYVNVPTQQELLRNAQALVYPSVYEGFGFPALEALQVSVPVIASLAGALPEVLGNAAVFVDPYVVGDIANAMREVGHNTMLRNTLQHEAKQTVQQYNWHTAAKQVLEVFAKVAT